MARQRGPALRVRSAAEESLAANGDGLRRPDWEQSRREEWKAPSSGGLKAWEACVELQEGWDAGASRVGGDEKPWRTRAKRRTRRHCESRHCLTSIRRLGVAGLDGWYCEVSGVRGGVRRLKESGLPKRDGRLENL